MAEVISLYGQILRWPRKSDRGLVLAVVEDEPKKVVFEGKDLGWLPLRKGCLVRLYGVWEERGKKGRKRIFSLREKPQVIADFSEMDIDTLAACGLSMSVEELHRVLESVECRSVYQLYCMWVEQPQQIEEAIGEAKQIVPFLRDMLGSQSVSLLNNLIDEIGLKDIGLDLPAALRIVEDLEGRAQRHKTTIAAMILDEPWIISQAEGINFKYGDALANLLGKDKESPARVYHCAISILLDESMQGNSYLPDNELIKRVRYRLGNKEPFPDFAQRFRQIMQDYKDKPGYRGRVVYDTRVAASLLDSEGLYYRDEDLTDDEIKRKRAIKREHQGTYLASVFFSEWRAAQYAEILGRKVSSIPVSKLRKAAREIALAEGKPLDESQLQAIAAVGESRLVIWDGAAGTGKTFLTGVLVKALRAIGIEEVLTAAPTGIAAARLQDASGYPTVTMHRLLHLNSPDLADDYQPPVPLLSNAKVIIVDEAGMMDVVLLARLFKSACDSVKGETRKIGDITNDITFVFVGDEGQLGAVGPGDMLRAFKTVPGASVSNLKVCHRSGDVITEQAWMIRDGNTEGMESVSGKFEIVALDNGTPARISEMAQEKIKELLGVYPAEGILVLTPDRTVQVTGATELNTKLRPLFLPQAKGIGYIKDDRVICIKNDYRDSLAVYNGTRGRVTEVTDELVQIEWDTPGEKTVKQYNYSDAARYVALAYALTVHKAQGCESPAVVYVDAGARSWGRNVLYTAVTRAKGGTVVLVVPSGRLEEMTARVDRRYCHLAERVRFWAKGIQPPPDERFKRRPVYVPPDTGMEIVAATFSPDSGGQSFG